MPKHPADDPRAILHDPLRNKNLAFTQKERDTLHLNGLLPPHEATLDEQCERAYEQITQKDNDLEKHIFLRSLQDSNEVLFYALLTRHIEEMMPIIYTPIVGAGCIHFSHIYRHPRGIFISYPMQDKIDAMLSPACYDNVKVIVVTDGERILGLGDQGANGMGIPIGKLSLYTACAGIHPAQTLPITLDVGTNNADNLKDPLYVGWHHERITGKAYSDFVQRFVKAVKKRFPHVLLQWEDFAQQNANPILAKYRDKLCTFNDDIQGTAAVTVGTLIAAIHLNGQALKDQRIAVLGGGSAGCGISSLLAKAMQAGGLSEKEALSRFYIVDKDGLLTQNQKNLRPFQKPFAKPKSVYAQWHCENEHQLSLLDVIQNVKPTVLIGVSGVGGAFTKPIITAMAQHVDRPIIFPLSNPTSHAEAKPLSLMAWTENKAIIGTGSPFPPVIVHGKSKTIAQTNNAYIFPGLGLGLIAAKATRVTDEMFMIAAKTLADTSPSKHNPDAPLLPPFSDIRKVSLKIAKQIALEALRAGLSPYQDEEEVLRAVSALVWEPVYQAV